MTVDDAVKLLDALRADLAQFDGEDLDGRIHGTTQESSPDRFRSEQPHCMPIPATAFLGTHEQTRTVSRGCLGSFGGSRYSVPWKPARRQSPGRCILRSFEGVRAQPHREGATFRRKVQRDDDCVQTALDLHRRCAGHRVCIR